MREVKYLRNQTLGPPRGLGERHYPFDEVHLSSLDSPSHISCHPPSRDNELVVMMLLSRSGVITKSVSSRFASILRPSIRSMATVRSSLPHEDRTAAEPRESRLEPVVLSNVRQVNENIRLLRLNAADPNHTIKVSPCELILKLS